MPLAPDIIKRPGPLTIPYTYAMGATEYLQVVSAFAHWDGTLASGAFLPALSFYDPAGSLFMRVFPSASIPAGGTADVTYAPFPGGLAQAGASGSGVPPYGALDDYVFTNTNITVTGIGFGSQANLLIQGNPITLDGNTRIKIEFFAPAAESTNTPPSNQAIGFELWDGATNKGTMAYLIGNSKAAGITLDTGSPIYTSVILTPSAGVHTYAIYAFKNVAGGTCVVYSNTFVDGTGNFAPMWYRVTTT